MYSRIGLFVCLLIATVAAQKSLPAGIFDHFKFESVVSSSPSPCLTSPLILYTSAYDASLGNSKSILDCGSSSSASIIDCSAGISALVQCAGLNNNCSCTTYKVPTTQPGCGFSGPYNVSSFIYAGERLWFGNTPVESWHSVYNGHSMSSLYVAKGGAIVGSEFVEVGKSSMTTFVTKWNPMPVDPKEFAIPSFCPPPKEYANAKHINSVLHM